MIEFPRYKAKEAKQFSKNRWWLGLTMGDVLDRTADVFSNKEALVDDRIRLTYSELRNKVDHLAMGLMNLGIEKGSTVLLQLPNWAEYVYSYCGRDGRGLYIQSGCGSYPGYFSTFIPR
jgi:2,3-dihydroxybenzoate-AMP ligase/mycobactin salicyl-AMP ligase